MYQAYFGSDDFSLNIPNLHPDNTLLKNGYRPWIFLSIVIEKKSKWKEQKDQGWQMGLVSVKKIAQKCGVHAAYLDAAQDNGSDFL